MADADLLPELQRALQAMRSAAQMLREPQPDTGAVAFMCAGAEKRLAALVDALEGARPAGRRVLIADPDGAWSDVLAETLRLEGHAVRTAATSAEALAACSAFRPEVVLVELGMTGHDGARNLRSLGDPAVMAAVTRWSRESDRQLALQAGFWHYLHKPVSPVAVAQLVSTMPELSSVPAAAARVAVPIKTRRRPGAARKASA